VVDGVLEPIASISELITFSEPQPGLAPARSALRCRWCQQRRNRGVLELLEASVILVASAWPVDQISLRCAGDGRSEARGLVFHRRIECIVQGNPLIQRIVTSSKAID